MAAPGAPRRKKLQRFEDTRSFSVLRKRFDSRKQTLFEKAIQLEVSTRCKVLLVVIPPLLLPTAETLFYAADESLEKSLFKPGIVNKQNYNRIDRKKWLAEMGQDMEVECAPAFANVTDDVKFSQPCNDPDASSSETKEESSTPKERKIKEGSRSLDSALSDRSNAGAQASKDAEEKSPKRRNKRDAPSHSQVTRSVNVSKCVSHHSDDLDSLASGARGESLSSAPDLTPSAKISTGAKGTKNTEKKFLRPKDKNNTSSHSPVTKSTGSSKDLLSGAGENSFSKKSKETKRKTQFQPYQHKFATNEDLARDIRRVRARKKANVKERKAVACQRRVPYDSTSSSDTDSDSSDCDGDQHLLSGAITNFTAEQTQTTITIIGEGDIRANHVGSPKVEDCAGQSTEMSGEVGSKSVHTTQKNNAKRPKYSNVETRAGKSVVKEQHSNVKERTSKVETQEQHPRRSAQKLDVEGLEKRVGRNASASAGTTVTDSRQSESQRETGTCRSISLPPRCAKNADKKMHHADSRSSQASTNKPRKTQSSQKGGNETQRNSDTVHGGNGSFMKGKKRAFCGAHGGNIPKSHATDLKKTANDCKNVRSATWNCTRPQTWTKPVTSDKRSNQRSCKNHMEGRNRDHPQKNCVNPLVNIKQERNPYEWIPNAAKGVKRTGSSTTADELPSKMRSLHNSMGTHVAKGAKMKECPPPGDRLKAGFTHSPAAQRSPRPKYDKYVGSSGGRHSFSSMPNSNRMPLSDPERKSNCYSQAYRQNFTSTPQQSFRTSTEPRFRCDISKPRMGLYTKQYGQPFRPKPQSWQSRSDVRYQQGRPRRWSTGPHPHWKSFDRENQNYY